MSRIAHSFAAHKPALIPFITGGAPSLKATQQCLVAMAQAGAAIIEVGFPFTDPIADGPVIAKSMHQALLAGVTPNTVMQAVSEVRNEVSVPVVAMVSISIVTRIGPERFIARCAECGFDGLIVPDADLEAAEPISGLARVHGLDFIMLVAPTTSPQRLARIADACTGFVYVLARVGVTGERAELDEAALQNRVQAVRGCTTLPVAVGFGVSTAEQVRRIGAIADGVIVGSALVRRMMDAGEAGAVESAAAFVHELLA